MLTRHDEKFLTDAQRTAAEFLKDGMEHSPLDVRIATACCEFAGLPLSETLMDASATKVSDAVYDVSRLFVERGDAAHNKDLLFSFTRCVNLFLIAHGGKNARTEFNKWRELLRKFCGSPAVG